MKTRQFLSKLAWLFPLLLGLWLATPAGAGELKPLTVDSAMGDLLDNDAARAVLSKHVAILVKSPQIQQARNQSLRSLQLFVPTLLTEEKLQRINAELAAEPAAVAKPRPLAATNLGDPSKAFQFDTIPLWSSRAPDARGEAKQDVPTLTVILPEGAAANGSAVIVAPGGGYLGLATGHEGRMVGDWFAAHGFTAFVLTYRLVPFGYTHPAQLHDARRAIRWVRAHAEDYGVQPDRIAMIGFSAGAHLTAMASTLFDPGNPAATDPVEKMSSRPDFAILAYPAITKSLKSLEGSNPSAATLREIYPARNVRSDTPPTFIFHTSTDELVEPGNSLAYYQALRDAKVPAELHIFEEGRHGLGLAQGDPAVGAWTSLLRNWLDKHRLLTPAFR